MVRIIRSLAVEYAVFNGGGTDAAKKTQLTTLLDTLGTTGLGPHLEDEVLAVASDYYWATDTAGKARVQDPNDVGQTTGRVAALRQIATGAQAFDANAVITQLNAIDATFVGWRMGIANYGGGWRSATNRLYLLSRITQYPGLQRSFEDVSAGHVQNANGVAYNAHPFQNNPSVLPLGVAYTTFDWIQNDNNRGPKRGVAGTDGSLYVTDDHYQAFERILATGTNPVIMPPPPFIAS